MAETPTVVSIARNHETLCNILDEVRDRIRKPGTDLQKIKFEAWNPEAVICRSRRNYIDTGEWLGYEQEACQIGWTKIAGDWCFAVRQVKIAAEYDVGTREHDISPPEQDEDDLEHVRLADASRKILLALFEELPRGSDDKHILDTLRNLVLQAMEARMLNLTHAFHELLCGPEKELPAS